MYTVTRLCIATSILTGIFAHAAIKINKAGSSDNNPWAYNVPKAFSNIPVRADVFLSVWTNDIIVPPRYTQTIANRYQGIWGGLNHFQSIKRLPEHLGLGNLIAFTGTDPHTPESQLFIAQLDSKNKTGLLTKNITKGMPPTNHKLIKKITLSSDYWYAGSVDMAGQYLAVPMHKNNDSCILFYKISYPDKEEHLPENLLIEELDIPIERRSMDASAVALTRLEDGYYLLAVWTEGSTNKDRGLDFYCSKDTNLTNGFDVKQMIHIPASLFYNYTGKNHYQNINFVNDYAGDLYLIALENTDAQEQLKSGSDLATLFKITIREVTNAMIANARRYDPKSITAQLKIGTKRPYVLFMKEKHMFCKQGFCNFSSGATVYIPDQQHILIYSLPYFLIDQGKQLNFAQFGSIQKTYP